jgi:8-oxo-dGTP pyrophosphatase MutT (NUDIX family)
MRELILERLANLPSLDSLLTADDLEKQAEASRMPLRPAAVLLLVVNHPEPTVVFTQRTADLADHAGQIAFPGGRREECDPSPEATALREASEEIGLDTGRVQVLGRLPEYRTGTGFAVTPVVGWAEPPVEYAPDPREVADVFEVPLSFLLDARNHRYESAFYRGRMRHYWAMPYGERFIWGATAGMLVTFHRLVTPATLPTTLAQALSGAPAGGACILDKPI